jgi:fatty-acid peroxygenase
LPSIGRAGPIKAALPMSALPKAEGFDQTLALRREGYRFIANRCEALKSDAFVARLMLTRVVCLRGAAAAELFYAGERVRRVGALPMRALLRLPDFGNVQTLDGEAHRARKKLYLELANPRRVRELCAVTAQEWLATFERLPQDAPIALFDVTREILTRAVLRWSGLICDETEIGKRLVEFSEINEAAGAIGPHNWRARFLRWRSERCGRRIIWDARAGSLPISSHAPVGLIAAHRDDGGELLSGRTAAVELMTLLRETVSVARFIVFAALALDREPGAWTRIADGDEEYLSRFVAEVRRLAPFVPWVGGRARCDFAWNGHSFRAGDWLLLDLYGTNRHPRHWPQSDTFDPDRYLIRPDGAFDYVAQGGGTAAGNHRCPGERPTVELTKTAVRLLTRALSYRVPEQDLTVDLTRIPALPASGFLISDVRLTASHAEAGPPLAPRDRNRA